LVAREEISPKQKGLHLQICICTTNVRQRILMTYMTKQKRDTEAHRKAAQKLTFETELCGDLIGKYLVNVPEATRPYVRLALDDLIIRLRNLWWPHFANEWKRDHARELLRLIRSIFRRWGNAHFERPLVLHQLATNRKYKSKQMTEYLNEKRIGIIELPKTERQSEARRSADRQELSRGSRPFRVPKKKANL
jgi:hypothetical protein